MTTETISGGKQIPGFADHLAELLVAIRGMNLESHRAWAKSIHRARIIYLLYGILDGGNLSYSLAKLLFDIFFANSKISSADAMRDWMTSPEGAAIIAASSVTLIVFSMLANYFDDDDKDLFKRYTAIVWPYCREVMKGLKNAYKGVRSTFLVFELLGLGGQDLRHMIVPVGLLLGGLLVLNRLWFRSMIGQSRKDMMKANSDLLGDIKNSPHLSLEEIVAKRKVIGRYSERLRAAALFSAAYGGIVDGLYLYVGVLGICSLAPAVLQAMSVFCAIYFLACVATRVYEEYNYQRLLLITEARIDLAVYGKEIGLLLSQLEQKSQVTLEGGAADLLVLAEQKELALKKLTLAVEALKRKREELRSLSAVSYTSAILAGLGNGLAAYGALTSSMFAVASLLVLSSTAFPPNLLIGCIMLGMVCLTVFVARSVIAAHKHYAAQPKEDSFNSKFPEVLEILSVLKEKKEVCTVTDLEKLKATVLEGLKTERLSPSFVQAVFETWRSLFSGIGKGIRIIGFALCALQNIDEQGNYHDTPLMLNLMLASAVMHAIILSLRAYARGFGRPALLDEEAVAKSDAANAVPTTAADLSLPNENTILPAMQSDVSRFGRFWKQKHEPRSGSSANLISKEQHTHLRRTKSLGTLFYGAEPIVTVNADDHESSVSRDDSVLPNAVVVM